MNLVFLVSIMWVLITKLRSANTAETKQYRKATKALLVLFPLLGITYILMMQGPMEGVAGDVFRNTRALLVGLQGFTVALFYCFVNTEVQNTLRHRMSRWREARAVGGGRRYTLSGHSKDWSPRSRTESIRLGDVASGGSLLTPAYRKRESSASEATTTTLLGPRPARQRPPLRLRQRRARRRRAPRLPAPAHRGERRVSGGPIPPRPHAEAHRGEPCEGEAMASHPPDRRRSPTEEKAV
ncbi:hypothetical protein R5R35_003228 [Gryllus longicercus]|uniref:G-protein coupled receptors family 2 profile 2 domain-containing protein n=1 Tax=Gryllus longicercus TaxID=2509291 RepID=A0AAN9Z8J3_9ORTH